MKHMCADSDMTRDKGMPQVGLKFRNVLYKQYGWSVLALVAKESSVLALSSHE